MISNTPAISINKLGNYLPPEKKLTDKQLTEALKYISSSGGNITPTRFHITQQNLQGRKLQPLPPSNSLKISRE
jgi:hypothetical protein